MSESNDGEGSRLTRRRLLAGGAVVAAGATALAAAGDECQLVVTDLASGDRYLEVPVSKGDRVVLAYTHSVEKTPVRDVYIVEGEALRMERTEFSSFGAGLPTDGVYRIEDGYAVDSDERYAELTVAPSGVAGHELAVNGKRHDLTDAEGSVAITVEAGSFLSGAGLGVDMNSSATDRVGSEGP